MREFMEISAFFKNNFGFSTETMDALTKLGYFDSVELVEYRKKEIIVREGDKVDYVYFLVKGVVRWFFLDEKGNEMTDALIYGTGNFVLPYYYDYSPCLVDVQAITHVQMIKVPKLKYDAMMNYYPELLRTAIRIISNRHIEHWNFRVRILPQNSLERYKWFAEHHGTLIGRISNKYIASFLSMTPSTLSRVQKRFREMQPTS